MAKQGIHMICQQEMNNIKQIPIKNHKEENEETKKVAINTNKFADISGKIEK